MATELTIIPISDLQIMADAIAKSGLFGIKTRDQALALMLVAQSENKHPATVASEYHIIQGRPALKADAMLARFQAAGGSVKWTDMSDERVAAVFTHPQGGSVPIDWDMKRATAAQLTGKDGGMWKKYPRQMLRSRVISEGVRTCFPGATGGFYVPEEVQQFEPIKERPGEVVIDMKPTRPVENALGDWGDENPDQMEILRELGSLLVQMIEVDGNPVGAYAHLNEQNLDQEQKLALWSILGPNTKTRAALKKEGAVRAKNSRGEISNAVEDLHSSAST